MRIRWLLVSIWICFLFRGWFYASVFPLWEGYDEFAHFGVVRAMTAKGILLVPRDQPGPREVTARRACIAFHRTHVEGLRHDLCVGKQNPELAEFRTHALVSQLGFSSVDGGPLVIAPLREGIKVRSCGSEATDKK